MGGGVKEYKQMQRFPPPRAEKIEQVLVAVIRPLDDRSRDGAGGKGGRGRGRAAMKRIHGYLLLITVCY